MVVRDKVGRNRYVAFVVTPPVEKARLLAALKSAPGSDRPWLVDYDGGRGLVRCAHTSKDATIELLNALRIGDARLRTTGTSGTIRKARAKFLPPKSPTRDRVK
ncbi:MAG: hypothetical protein E6K18_00245 [Methanobacteriota archaeon]|nr:MAG: hypothetical protein E6K18_00245 [Euryarchaeota archaeon]